MTKPTPQDRLYTQSKAIEKIADSIILSNIVGRHINTVDSAAALDAVRDIINNIEHLVKQLSTAIEDISSVLNGGARMGSDQINRLKSRLHRICSIQQEMTSFVSLVHKTVLDMQRSPRIFMDYYSMRVDAFAYNLQSQAVKLNTECQAA